MLARLIQKVRRLSPRQSDSDSHKKQRFGLFRLNMNGKLSPFSPNNKEQCLNWTIMMATFVYLGFMQLRVCAGILTVFQ